MDAPEVGTGRGTRVRNVVPELAIVVAAVLYGSTFILVQGALDDTTPSAFNLARFGLGAAVLAPFALRRGWRGPRPRPGDSAWTMVASGVAIGVVAWVAYSLQNVGLTYTTTSNSAFITGLFAVFVAIFEGILLRRRPRATTVVAVVVAVVGLALLTGAQPSANVGDLITLGAAVGFGLWFIQIAIFTPRFDVVTLVALEAGTVAVLSLPLALVGGVGSWTIDVGVAVAFTGIGCTAIAFCLSTWAQRQVEASRAGIIALFEPVVAGALGYAVGERLGVGGYLGAACILVAMVVAESSSWWDRRPPLPPHVG